MSSRPSYAPCEVTLEFGDGEHLFRLPLKQIAELQEKCDAPLGVVYERVRTGRYKGEDLVETVRLGLIGGGMSGPDARKMIERYCDTWPMDVWHTHALAVLAACIHGYEPSEDQPAEKKSAVTNGSTSPEPTATGSPPDTASRKSSA